MTSVKTTTIQVRNPRTGKYDYEIEPMSEKDIIEKCQILREGQEQWRDLGVNGRFEVLKKWQEALKESKEELLTAVTNDTGRVRESVREVEGVINWIDRWGEIAKKELEPLTQETHLDFIQMESDYSPYPLLGVISPWNFPMSLSLMDAIPALLAGCAVIVKPSEITPRFINPIMKTITKVPELANIFTYVTGAGETGQHILENVDMLCFTGSVATGRKVSLEGAKRFIPVFTELGGKDPGIITESVDINRATSAVLVGAVLGAGHQCYSLERIYVQDTIIDEFVKSLCEKAEKLKFALPLPEDGEVGPLIFAPQADIINDHLEDALEKGAKIECGGKVEEIEGGFWCRPTVITGVNHNMKIMREETFGPVMPVMPFSHVDEAVELANDTEFGLSAAVLTGSLEESLKIARRIDAGGISINDTGLAPFFIGSEGKVEKTAFKCSGLGGSRLSSSSIKRFVRKKSLIYNTSSAYSPWWYEEK